MKRVALALVFVTASMVSGYVFAAAQSEVAHFTVTVTTTDRGAGVKMICKRGCHWKEVTFECGQGAADCSAQVDEQGVGGRRP